MVAAEVLYVPIRASQADLDTLPHVNELVGLARGLNPSLEAFALASMGRSNPVITEVREAQELLVDFTDLKLSPPIIADRNVYRDALLEGKGVVEMNNPEAKAEI